MPDDKTQYSPEFKEQLNSEVTSLYRDGHDDEYVDRFITAYKNEYKKKASTEPAQENIVQPAEKEEWELPEGYSEPQWYAESGLSYKDEEKRRPAFWKIFGSVGRHISDPRTDGKPDERYSINKIKEDKLTPEMVQDMDKMHEFAKLDDSENFSKNINAIRDNMRKKHNPDGHPATNRNIDLLLENAYMPEMVEKVREDVTKLTGQGYTHRDLVLGDPEVLKRLKKNYVREGYTGDIVDQAVYKAIEEDAKAVLLNNQLGIIDRHIDNYASENGISKADARNTVSTHLEQQWIRDAERKFNKDALKRAELVQELKKLHKNRSVDPDEVSRVQERIAAIDKKLGVTAELDVATSAASFLLSSNHVYIPKFKNKFRLYDDKGNRIIYGNESEEEIADEREISSAMQTIQKNPNFEQGLKENGFKQYLILQDIKQEKAAVESFLSDYPEHRFQNPKAMAAAGVDPKIVAQKRKLLHLERLEHEQEIMSQAHARLLFTNENLAMETKGVGYYLQDAAMEIRDKNNMGGIHAASSDAEIHEALREVYHDMGVSMTDEELKRTTPDNLLQVTRGMADLADLTVKLMVMDGIASNLGAAELFKAIGSGTKTLRFGKRSYKTKAFNKVAENIVRAGWEGVKFEVAAGDYGTGFAFAESQALLGNVGRALPRSLRGIAKVITAGAAGMTISMEAVAQVDAVMDALSNNKDVVRAMQDSFGTWDEAEKRILIEMATALPFGMRAYANLAKNGAYKSSAKMVEKMARKAEKSGDKELAQDLRSFLPALSSPESRQKTRQTEARHEWLIENAEGLTPAQIKKLDKMNGPEVNELYREQTQGKGDPVGEKYGDMADGAIYEEQFLYDIVEDQAQIQTLKNHGISLRGKTRGQVQAEYKKITEEVNDLYGDVPVETVEAMRFTSKNKQDIVVEPGKEPTKVEDVKAETKATHKRVAKKLKKPPKKIDFISNSKLAVARELFGGTPEGALQLTTKLEAIKKAVKHPYEKDLLQAQIDALKHTGSRESAVTRMKELAESEKGMTQKELLEYDMLEFVGGKDMPLRDLKLAEANMKSIVETGRSIYENRRKRDVWQRQEEVRLAAESLGTTIQDLKARQNFDTKMNALVKAARSFRLSTESFFTLMETLMRSTPGREQFGGFLHSISNDFHRASEHSKSQFLEWSFDVFDAQSRIFKTKDQAELNSRLKANKKRHNASFTIFDKQQSIGKRSVNQIYRLWQQSLNPNSLTWFKNSGWGIYEGKFDAKRLQQEFADFIVTHGGKESLEWAKWQVEEFFPKIYPKVNEVYRRIHGKDLGFEVNYSSRVAEHDGRSGDINDILSSNPDFFIASASHSALKARKAKSGKHNTKVDGDALLKRYMEKMAHYIHFQEPLKRSQNILENELIGKHLSQREGGDYVKNIIKEFHDDIAKNEGGNRRFGRIPIIDKLAISVTRAHLGLNLGLWPKQMVSIDAYRTMIPSGLQSEFTKNMLLNPDFFKTARRLGQSMFGKNRAALSGFNIELNRIETQAAALARTRGTSMVKGGKDWWKLDSMKDNILIMGKIGDMMAIKGGGVPFFTTMKNEYMKEGHSEANAEKLAYQDFVRTTKLTQQSADVADKSRIQRAGSLGRLASLYQNTPQQYRRMERIAIDNMIVGARHLKGLKKGTPEHKIAKEKFNKGVSNFLLYHFILPGMFRAASQWGYVGDADLMDDKGMLVALALGTLSYEFLVGDIITNLVEQVVTGHAFDPEAMPIAQSVIDNTMEFATMIRESFTEEPVKYHDVMDAVYGWSKKLEFVTEVTGVPATSAVSLVKGWYDLAVGKTDDPRALVGLSEAGRGAHQRSPDAPIISRFQNNDKSISEFYEYMLDMHHQDLDYFKRNKARWAREWRIYEEFGMNDVHVNLLYSGGLTAKQKAEYLYKLKYHDFAIADASLRLIHDMAMTEPYDIDNQIKKYLSYRVIGQDVLKELILLEKDKGKR
jgi:hypothetical protein